MKKIIFTLLIFIFSCSENENESNQTFLERFDGKMFERRVEIGQAPSGNTSFRYVKFDNSLNFYSVTYPKSSITEDILYCATYSEGVNDFREKELSCEGCKPSNEVNTLTILENTKDQLKFSWKMDYYSNGVTNAEGEVIDDISYIGTWLYEVNNGKIIETVQDEIGNILWSGNLQETTVDFNSLCESIVLSN